MNDDLLAAVAELDVPAVDRGGALREAVAGLSREELVAYLLRVADGEGARVSGELNRPTGSSVPTDGPRRRSLGELWKSVNACREARLRRETEEKERKERERKAKRKTFLTSLIGKADTVWQEAYTLADRKNGSAYDEAAGKLKDLRDAYALANRLREFKVKLQAYTTKYSNRPALLRRVHNLSSAW